MDNQKVYNYNQRMLKLTPLSGEHAVMGARSGEFSGWQMPVSYTSILEEHAWCRKNACVFDTCHMGQLRFYGPPGAVEKFFTRNLSRLSPGRAVYGFMLNNKGGIIDDMLVYRLGAEELMFVSNSGSREKVAALLQTAAEGKVADNSNSSAKIDLQGPFSREVMKDVFGTAPEMKVFGFLPMKLSGADCLVSRTGYTGELGFEIYCRAEEAPAVWKKLLSDKRVRPAGLGARDILRLEMGYPLYGSDIDEETTPLEARLERFIDPEKDFTGRDALESLKAKGPGKLLTGIRTFSRRAPRTGADILFRDEAIGMVTSGVFSPALGCGIGMGYIKVGFSGPGEEVSISGIDAVTAELPFYRAGTRNA